MKLAVALAVLPAAAAFVGPAAAPAETRLRETKADLEALVKALERNGTLTSTRSVPPPYLLPCCQQPFIVLAF